MHRILQYIFLFLVVTALQVFLFDNLQLSLYVHPFAYLAFVLLLPMEIQGYALLLLAAALGVTMDFFSGMPGVNTIATVATAFCRPTALRFFVGKDLVGDGGMPNARRIGTGKFLRYALVLTLVHSVVYFVLENLSTVNVLFTVLRIVINTLCSLVVVWFIQLLFVSRKSQGR